MSDDNPRITSLTTDAIRSIGEKMVEEIRRQVKQVDEMAAGIHELAKVYEDEIGMRTLELTDHITAYTALGAKTTEMFRAMSEAMAPLKTNGDATKKPDPAVTGVRLQEVRGRSERREDTI